MNASNDTSGESSLTRDGKLSYVQIPALDAGESARFYSEVFGWSVRPGSPDHTSFEDTSGELIGAWVTGRQIVSEPGVLPYIYVDDVDAALDRIVAKGGSVVKPPYDEGGQGALWVALFRDPAGNVLGVWKMGSR